MIPNITFDVLVDLRFSLISVIRSILRCRGLDLESGKGYEYQVD
jgi:hypothetical protein